MTRRDGLFFALFAAVSAAIFAPVLFSVPLAAGNFGDMYAYHLPLRGLVASRLQGGELPFWNPYIFGGQPLLANPQCGLFYPGTLGALFWTPGTAFDWIQWGHVLLAFFGMQLLLRRSGLSSCGAAVLASAYGLSQFLILRVPQGVPTLLFSLSYAPWIWLLADRPLPLALALALQFLSGHPQFMAVNLLALGLYLAFFRRRTLLPLALGGAAALLITAVQLAPTLEFLGRSVRTAWSSVFTTGYSLPPAALGGILMPDILGSPIVGTFNAPPSLYFELTNLYMGIAAAVLAGIGLWKGRRAGPLLLIGAGVFLALGENNPIYRLLASLPVFNLIRAPARFSMIVLLGLLIAAGRGWVWASRRWPRWPWRAAVLAFTLLDLGRCGVRAVYAEPLAAKMAANRAPYQGMIAGARAATAPELANPNKLMLYRVPNATGYEAFYLASAALYTSVSQRVPSADASRTYIDRIDTEGMEALGVRYLLTLEEKKGALVFQRGALRVYENPRARPPVFFERGGAAETVRREDEAWTVRYRTGRGGDLVVSDAAYPGWRAWVDGRPAKVLPWRGFLKSVFVPPGEGRVDLLYRPSRWLGWVLASLLGLGLLAVPARWRLRG